MLVLTRRIGEEIVIGGNIRVMLVSIRGRQARLGVEAPPSIPVTRLELMADRNGPDNGPASPRSRAP
jgi:carbon storage regulator